MVRVRERSVSVLGWLQLVPAKMATEVAFEQLHAKYADSDTSEEPNETELAAPEVLQPASNENDNSSPHFQTVTQQIGDAAENEYEEWPEYDEEDDDSADDEDLYAALEWADDREG